MSFQSQRDLTDAKHHAMIWDILLHKGGGGGLLRGISLLVRQ